jgi:hypothetical protein
MRPSAAGLVPGPIPLPAGILSRVQGSGVRDQGSRVRVQVRGARFGTQGSGLRAQGSVYSGFTPMQALGLAAPRSVEFLFAVTMTRDTRKYGCREQGIPPGRRECKSHTVVGPTIVSPKGGLVSRMERGERPGVAGGLGGGSAVFFFFF